MQAVTFLSSLFSSSLAGLRRHVSSVLVFSLLGMSVFPTFFNISAYAWGKKHASQQQQEPETTEQSAQPAAAAADTPALPEASSEKSSEHTPDETDSAPEKAPEKTVVGPELGLQNKVNDLSPEAKQSLLALTEKLQGIHHQIGNTLADDQETALKDLAMLWQASVERSGTIRYAIEKLSRRDATGKPVEQDQFTKRILQSVARLGGVAGAMWTGSPASLVGSNMAQELLRTDPTDGVTSRVTDTDMVILAKEVDQLQTQLIEKYYLYQQAYGQWQLNQQAVRVIEGHFDTLEKANEKSKDNKALGKQADVIKPLLETMLDSARHEAHLAEQAYGSARNDLGLLVGSDALAALDKTRETAAADVDASR